jgi:hypothetical protein
MQSKGNQMRSFKIVAYVIGVSQLALAAIYFLAPVWFVTWQGLTVPAADIGYPLGMLAGRFLVYGVGMFVIAQDPEKHQFWARGMIGIQVLDFAAGAFYVATGVVAIADAALPLFDAALFAAAIYVTLGWALKEKAATA